MDTHGGGNRASRWRGSRLELGLLAVSLVALVLGAGAVGWTLGHNAKGESAVATTSASSATTSASSATTSASHPLQRQPHPPATTTASTTTTSASTATTPTPPPIEGDPVAGKAVFIDTGCSSCHTVAAAGAHGTVGPNLDQVDLSVSEALDWVSNGRGAMPSYKGQLSAKKLADLAVFVAK